MTTYIVKNVRAARTTPAQAKIHPLRLLTIYGQFHAAVEAADGSLTAGAPMTRPALILTNGRETVENAKGQTVTAPNTIDRARTSLTTDSGLADLTERGILTIEGGERGRPEAQGESAASLASLLGLARTSARPTLGADGYASIGAPAPTSSGKARKA